MSQNFRGRFFFLEKKKEKAITLIIIKYRHQMLLVQVMPIIPLREAIAASSPMHFFKKKDDNVHHHQQVRWWCVASVEVSKRSPPSSRPPITATARFLRWYRPSSSCACRSPAADASKTSDSFPLDILSERKKFICCVREGERGGIRKMALANVNANVKDIVSSAPVVVFRLVSWWR